jgi:hypothetical protein
MLNNFLSSRAIKVALPFAIAFLLFCAITGFSQQADLSSEKPLRVQDISWSQNGVTSLLRMMEEYTYGADMECRLDTAAVDIVFCMDTSRSMGPMIAELRTELAALVLELEARHYDYRLGGVAFDDLVNVWDFDAVTPGAQMTASSVDFLAKLAITGENTISSDLYECPLDAICDAINLYTWRPDAMHIIFMFTNEGYHYRGDGTAWSDVTLAETRALVFSTGTVVFIAASNTNTHQLPLAIRNQYQQLAEDSGGRWYMLEPVDFGPIFDDIVALLNTFVRVGATIINEGSTACIINAELMPNNPTV